MYNEYYASLFIFSDEVLEQENRKSLEKVGTPYKKSLEKVEKNRKSPLKKLKLDFIWPYKIIRDTTVC